MNNQTLIVGGLIEGLLASYELSGSHEKAIWAAENITRINPKYSLEEDIVLMLKKNVHDALSVFLHSCGWP